MTRVQIDEERIDAIFALFNDCYAPGGVIPKSSPDPLSFYRGVGDVGFAPGIASPYSKGDSPLPTRSYRAHNRRALACEIECTPESGPGDFWGAGASGLDSRERSKASSWP
jgi:hypothetical protein